MNDQKDTKDPLVEFAHSIEQLAEAVNEIAQIEEEKADAAAQSRHDQMDGFLKREQVSILKLRGLEQKRLRLAADMGWKDLTFRQILDRATIEQQECLSPLFTRLDSQIARLRTAKDSAERMINVRLREFDYILSTGNSEGYDEAANAVKGPSSLFHDRYV